MPVGPDGRHIPAGEWYARAIARGVLLGLMLVVAFMAGTCYRDQPEYVARNENEVLRRIVARCDETKVITRIAMRRTSEILEDVIGPNADARFVKDIQP